MRKRGNGSIDGRFIMALTDKDIEEFAVRPQIKMLSAGYPSKGYSWNQCGFIV